MNSQPHKTSPTHHQPNCLPIRTEYHNSERSQPLPESYYPHPLYYGYHSQPHSPHHMSYHSVLMNPAMPPVSHLDEYQDHIPKRAKLSSADIPDFTATSEANDKNRSTIKFPAPQNLLDKAKFKKDRFGTFNMEIKEEDKRTYSLIVCQQPLRARMCGFGEKDRRPVDPPPIVQLVVNDKNGNLDSSMLQNPFFVLHVTLWSEDCTEERNVISNPPKTTRVLMGSLVSSPAILKNTDGELGCYFCFPDLSIRTEGKYTLKFALMKLGTDDRLINTRTEIITTTFSDPFTVYSAKKFPGMTESTELSKAFAKQGLKIPIRNDVRPRKIYED